MTTDSLRMLFSAWGQPEPDDRAATTDAAIDTGFEYTDPSLPGIMAGREAYLAHLDQFGAAMPGASAEVVDISETNGFARVTVDFFAGGKAMMRGQYFAEMSDGKVRRIVGFTGTGTPE